MSSKKVGISPLFSAPDTDDQPPPNRRKTVFAESHDPERDATDKVSIKAHPKTDEQHQFLLRECSQCFLFRQLEKSDLVSVVESMKEVKVKPGQTIIHQGDEGDNCYIIQKGRFEAWVSKTSGGAKHNAVATDSVKVKEYRDGGLFGELALMYSTPRAATVIAKTDGVIWALDRVVFQKLVLSKVFKRRQQHIQFLKSIPLLKDLSSSELMNVAEAIVLRKYNNGEQIIQQGSVGEEMFFVEEGEVSIRCAQRRNSDASRKSGKSAAAEKELCRIHKGGHFGELALVTKKPRAASAFAVGSVRVAVLDIESFERLLGPCKQVIQRNMQEYDSQLKKFMSPSLNRI